MYDSCSIEALPLLEYLSYIPRYIDLFRLVQMVRGNLHHVKIPTLLIHSQQDEFVREKSVSIFKMKAVSCPYKIMMLPQSGHFYYVKDESERIKVTFQQFISEMEPNNESLF